ncbi:MAG: 4Fe-4S dicluster domain-containing protein [Thermoanaerobaculia bacterium]
MAELTPVPFPDLVRRMRREVATAEAIFDLPVKKWWTPDPDVDFSATHFDRRAATPVGPAAGPHTQLAQNIVLSWLAGSRIIELKTVQINDRLELPRPCIHVPNVGYNVEWSQELLVHQSLMEYAKACYLIEILKTTRAFGVFGSDHGFDVIYDISVGYDLEGVQSEKVTGFIRGLQNPRPYFDALRQELDGDLAEYRDLELPAAISDCVTLSTFHGCPADQIESIARYLIDDLGLHTIIKLNPTLLGFDAVRELLHERLGYTHLELRRDAFDMDLSYDGGLEILRRLRELAESRGSIIGAKFTNTLVVANREDFFPTQTDPYMYLSGQPLLVISMTLMQRFREELGFEFPVSFSAGVDAKNFPTAVACGMVPVTTCTDLLRQGGYGRLPGYLKALGKAMKRVGVSSREAYVLAARGHGGKAAEEALRTFDGGVLGDEAARLSTLASDDPDTLPAALRRAAQAAGIDGDRLVLHATRVAGRLNGRDLVPPLADEPRYHADRNKKTPKRIDSTLALYDCINCDLCIGACPNDAIFAYDAEPVTTVTEILAGGADGLERRPGAGFEIGERHQLAVLEGGCNDCSNCEVYCPEDGAPFVVKERLFPDRDTFARSPDLDGFYRANGTLHARLGGIEMRFAPEPADNRAVVDGDGFRLELSWEPFAVVKGYISGPETLDTALLWRMRTVWQSMRGAG